MLILCDFDGTATAIDTLDHLTQRFAPATYASLQGALLGGKRTLRDVLATELAAMQQGADAIVGAAVAEVPLREGFPEFVRWAKESGHALVILSAGFHEFIAPILSAAGVDLADLTIVANSVTFSDAGGVVTWRDLPICAICGEECKRHDVQSLRAAHGTSMPVVYVGDGYSDRCGSQAANRVFATRGLSAWYTQQGLQFDHFDDFHEIQTALVTFDADE